MPIKKHSDTVRLSGYFYLTGNEPFTEWAFMTESRQEWLIKSDQIEQIKKLVHKPVSIIAHYGEKSRLNRPYLVIESIEVK